MKAIYYEDRGAARDVLRYGDHLPEPQPGPGEVLVRVSHSAVNPSDTKARQGTGPRPSPWPRIIPHQDGAGVIEAAGANVDKSRIGQRVWLHECQFGRPFGTAAEWIAVPEHLTLALPDTVSMAQGATLGIPALTAWLAMSRVAAGPGKRVLVHGAAGSVGFYAAQMARLLGADVLGAVSNTQQAAIIEAQGIPAVLRGGEMRKQALAHLGKSGGTGFDAIVDVDFSANLEANLELIATGGHIASYASDADLAPQIPVRTLMHKNLQLAFLLVYTMPADIKQHGIAQIYRWLEAGSLHFPEIRSYPLQAAADAHEAVETRRHVGKVVLEINSEV